jgi:hypothetical protein
VSFHAVPLQPAAHVRAIDACLSERLGRIAAARLWPNSRSQHSGEYTYASPSCGWLEK